MSDTKTNQPLFENAVQDYLESCSSARLSKNIAMGTPEFEIRFGQKIPISKIDYDNVVRELQIHKWRTDNIDGAQYLRITTEYYDSATYISTRGQTAYRMSNIRAEIVGADMVEIYCKTNSLEALKSTPAAHKKLKFTQKKSTPRAIGPTINGTPLPFIDYTDFNFRISSQFELGFPITSDDDQIRKITNDWNTARKHFRSINRVRFHHPDSLVFVDLSIVKSNKTYTSNTNTGTKKGKPIPIPCQTIQEAGVFHNAEHYEIELELNNEKITELADRSPISRTKLVQNIIDEIRKVIRIVLSGLQGTPYPISYSEQDAILKEYMLCIHNSHEKSEEELEEEVRNIRPYFLGPSSKTLQMINVLPDQNPVIPSIRTNYTVTEKADGERALLYISKKGKLYMIQTNLKIVFTGAITENKEYFDSLLDGEYIAYGKRESNDRIFLHLFAAFDIYFIGSRKITSVRELAFCTTDETADDSLYRLPLLENCIQHLKVQSLGQKGSNSVCTFQVKCKTFYMSDSAPSAAIFEGAEMIWNRRDTFEYEIDGLIFTPMNTGVGSDAAGKAHDLGKKITWDRSFKWKPPHYNTIDFLVAVQKDKQGKDIIRNKILTDEHNELTSRIQYKTLILKCGFDEKRHKFVNAFSDVLLNRVADPKGQKGSDQTLEQEETNSGTGFVAGKGYQPVPFQPTSPFDQDACFCNVVLEQGSSGSEVGIMRTKEDDVFQENMIVEFSYDREVQEKDTAWKWVPLRVRYDKTSELRAGKNNFGNDFTVANDNWHSIHFPITEKMIMGQEAPNEFAVDDTVYYNRQEKDSRETQALRDFHNLFVKRFLIEKIGKYLQEKVHIGNPILIDYAVGKAGDLSKWIRAGIAFVLGIDISKDNIINAKDGACVRYLGMRKQNPSMRLRAVFLHGNSGKNLLTTQKAFYTNQEKEVMKAVFGHGSAKEKPIAREYMGIARDGFHISSCQFAMHYFFASADSLHSFLRNLSECTKLGGYFTGTCYNGQRVFDLLRNKLQGESVRFDKNGKKIFELTRGYANAIESFPSGPESIGMAINVYQESIDKTFEEYLVNFVFLERVMEDYGFVLLTDSENASIGLGKTNASFEYLYRTMENKGSSSASSSSSASAKTSDYGKALEMTKEEKTISFLNQYFIFKKARNITAERLDKLYEKHVAKSGDSDGDSDGEKDLISSSGKRSFIRKIPEKKIVLSIEKYSPIVEKEENLFSEEVEEEGEVEDEVEEGEVEDFGEYTEFFQNLKPEVQSKIRNYPPEKQIEILKKLQKPKKKIVSIPTKK